MLLSCFLGILKTSMASYQSISFPNQAPLKYRHFYLYSAVSPICYDNISIRIYSHSSWCIKLSVSFSIWSKLQYEFSLLVKYLYGLKQKPEYGIVSNISNLLHTHTHTQRWRSPGTLLQLVHLSRRAECRYSTRSQPYRNTTEQIHSSLTSIILTHIENHGTLLSV